jgi:hypothetical protein
MHLLFEGRLTAGDILLCISLLISVFGAYAGLGNRLTKIEASQDLILEWFKTCTKGDCPMIKEIKDRNLLEALRGKGGS